MSGQFRASIEAVKRRLAEGHESLRARHDAGASGEEICAALAELRDEAVLALYADALSLLDPQTARSLEGRHALVALGGYGRREVAPYSDVDLMILHDLDDLAGLSRLAERMLCDVFDVGLDLGHSVRTPEEAVRLALADATISTALMEARLLAGNAALFARFADAMDGLLRRRGRKLLGEVQKSRAAERAKYGETTHLLEPNIKRSRGGLRDLHWVRWIGRARWGVAELDDLVKRGVMTPADADALRQANAVLLRLRNELHFAAGKPADVLDRGQQLRIATRWGYEPARAMLPVEQFMRDVFRHTGRVSHLVESLWAKASTTPATRVLTSLASRRVHGGLSAGPTTLEADRNALARLCGNLAGMVKLFETAAAYDKSIAPATLEALRSEVAALPEGVPANVEARRSFLKLLGHGSPMPALLRQMHDIGLLERLVPEFAHARGLLQFNQYHKYTVDEHSLLAVDSVVGLAKDPGPLGRIYRGVARKSLLHLALLLHDLGKGYAEDHSEVGRQIARRAAARFELDEDAAAELEFLVHRHLLMNHVALQRDTGDEHTVVGFAVEVGSPELLQMLTVFTMADLAAVGPDTWTSWKAEVLVGLYHRAIQHLAGEAVATSREEFVEERRGAVRGLLGASAERPWFVRQLPHLAAAYLESNPPEQIAADLEMLASLPANDVKTQARYLGETQTLQFTVATTEDVAEGIFHRLTGALTSQRLQILSAQINTLCDGLVLDRFWVVDPDHAGEPPPHRLDEIHAALRNALVSQGKTPVFRRVWSPGGASAHAAATQTRVLVDNATSGRYTILDVFTLDRHGLLYAITRTLFELGLSVWRAKIGTHLDQVVDVFYVTDARGGRIEDQNRLHAIRQRLLEVIEGADGAC